ncbi:MAG: KTSC domain-containing protein [Verrucomicrobiota bacterium]|jgi:hypothetical protein
MTIPGQPAVKMVPVDAKQFESVGYTISSRRLYIKYRDAATVYFEGVPGFRYSGLMAAPRKDAYFTTYIKNSFLAQQVPEPPA